MYRRVKGQFSGYGKVLENQRKLSLCLGRERQLHGMLENIAGNTGNLAASAGELGKSGSFDPQALL
jgi:hypothetical protein